MRRGPSGDSRILCAILGGGGMSCEVECIASGVQCMGQLAVEVGAAAPEGRGRRGKGRVRAHGRQGEGPWCVCVCGALLLELVGARGAAPAALLPRESRSPDASAACVGAKRKQRENPRRGRWGGEGRRGRCRREGATAHL